MTSKIFRVYYVWPRFPSLSMSGNMCTLQCKHCNHTYLNNMLPITTPDQLYHCAKELQKKDTVGFLLSGGCTTKGEMINLRRLLPTIEKIKQETNLIIKLHTGLVDRDLAESIVSAGVDIASLEIVGSKETIQAIFDFPATPETYAQTLRHLETAGMPHIVPHICIGLNHGKLSSEQHALEIIRSNCTPSVIVMIIFRPTKGTHLAHEKPPSPDEVASVIQYAKHKFPDIEISLGCMRPRTYLRQEIELAALHAGTSRMEIPAKTTLHHVQQMGYTIRYIDACCALLQEYEHPKIYHDSSNTHSHPQQITNTR